MCLILKLALFFRSPSKRFFMLWDSLLNSTSDLALTTALASMPGLDAVVLGAGMWFFKAPLKTNFGLFRSHLKRLLSRLIDIRTRTKVAGELTILFLLSF